MNSIFVSIASYCDPECRWTLRDLFEKARHPERVSVGLCWQSDRPDDDAPRQMATRPEQVRCVSVHARHSRGCWWAKAQAQTLWQDEDYVLLLDSHSRVAEGWDDELIEMLEQCPSDKPILSTYPAWYIPPDDRHPSTPHIVAERFLPESKLLRFVGVPMTASAPKRGAFVAGGFLFASSALLREVPWDPDLYFDVEVSVAVRVWSHGWDVFSPHRCLVYHYYGRDEAPKHWNEHERWSRLNDVSVQRVQHLLGIRTSLDPAVTAGLDGVYGLGSMRTLEEFEEYSGVRFREQRLSPKARSGEFVPDGVRGVSSVTRMRRRSAPNETADDPEPGDTDVLLAFGAHQVLITCRVPQVLSAIRGRYRHLIARDAGTLVGRLDVTDEDGEYALQTQDRTCVARDASIRGILSPLHRELVRRFIAARPDLIWLHAGAVARNGGAIVVAGPSGHGKSTLVTELHRRGWTYLSDDIVPFDPQTGIAWPFPQTPRVRQNRGQQLPPGQTSTLKRIDMPVATGLDLAPALMRFVVFPSYRHGGPTTVLRTAPGAAVLELLRACLSFVLHRDEAFRCFCDLLERLPAFTLSFDSGPRAAEMVLSVADGLTQEGHGAAMERVI